MNREGIRRLAAESCSCPLPLIVLPIAKAFSAGGCRHWLSLHCKTGDELFRQGQTFIRSAEQLAQAWEYAQQAVAPERAA